jgi:hypothetical protein
MHNVRLPVLLTWLAVGFAQSPPSASEKVPPEIESALRARVSQFYQYEVAGKFRQAEELVAEDSKDFFVGATKPTYTSFEIKSIRYTDGFTKATVNIKVERMVAVPGFLGKPVAMVMPSRWKLEKEQWCWYVDPNDLRTSPFGDTPLPGMASAGAPPGMPAIPGMSGMSVKPGALPSANTPAPASNPAAGVPLAPGTIPGPNTPGLPTMPSMAQIHALVKASKSVVKVKIGGASADQVVLVNRTMAHVTLGVIAPQVSGITAKLDRADLDASQAAILTVHSSGSIQAPEKPVTINVRVEPTKQVIPIQVSFF